MLLGKAGDRAIHFTQYLFINNYLLICAHVPFSVV